MQITCPHCWSPTELPELPSAEIVCPGCGSSFRLEGGTTAAWSPRAGQKLGRFEVLDMVGHGAFGTVYKARDPELDRVVAIKVPRAGNLSSTVDLDRFVREARSVAQLRHPAIVPVYEVGQADNLPYLVSEFVQGITLADLLSDVRPTVPESAQLIAAVADALQYAHEMGVVHRDVKPANIMLESSESAERGARSVERAVLSPLGAPRSALGAPRLMDFGLAKRDAGEVTMTLDGQVLGTPAYMSPEQARGEAHRVDGRSDVYSLGVVLYQLLTGELPFRGNTRMLLHHVLHDEPRPPRSLNHLIPRDLETICVKAMAKEPGRRYATARELADDLRRFLRTEPIHARPVSAWERGWNWARRRPALAGLLLVSGVAVLALVGVVTGLIYNARLEVALEKAEEAQASAEMYKYFHHIARAHMEWRDGDVGRVKPLLDDAPAGHRNWEWAYLKRLCHADLLTLKGHSPAGVFGVVFSPDGTRLVSASHDSTLRIWDAVTGREICTLEGHADIVWGVAISPDGARIASAGADHTVKVWDATSGQEIHTLKGHTDVVRGVAFSSDGAQIASAGAHTVRVWNVMTGKEVHTHAGYPEAFRAVAFSPDGTMLAAASEDKSVKIWNTSTRKQSHAFTGHTGTVTTVVFSPDGTRLASGSFDNTVKIWEPAMGREILTLKGHTSYVRGVAFSPDGARLASTGVDQSVRVWNARTGQEVFTIKGHTSEVIGVAYSPDGTRLASTSADGTVRVWSATPPQGIHTLKGHTGGVRGVAFSPDGKWLASASADQTVKIWETSTGQELNSFRGHTDQVLCVAMSPNGKQVASGDRNGWVNYWIATAPPKAWRSWKGHSGAVSCLAFSPDGKRLASAGHDAMVKVWDVTGRRETLSFKAHNGPVLGVTFSPDGQRLASGGRDSKLRISDSTTGRETLSFRAHAVWVGNVAFSPDGSMLASTGWDNHARIWDGTSGRLIHHLPHSTDVWSVAFSPDGKRLASASSDQTVKIWDTATGQEALSLKGHSGIVWSVAFSPDGSRLASGSEDGTVRIWDAGILTPEAPLEREALGLVEFLFARPLSKTDVIEYLNNSKTLRPEARQLALTLVKRYREEADPERYHQTSLNVVRQRYLNPFQYRFALRQAQTACRLAPRVGKYQTNLGAAQYRAGQYQEALATLTQANQINKSIPADLAFLAMTHYRLGRKEQAQATLARLRETMNSPAWTGDAVAQGLFGEALATVGGAK